MDQKLSLWKSLIEDDPESNEDIKSNRSESPRTLIITTNRDNTENLKIKESPFIVENNNDELLEKIQNNMVNAFQIQSDLEMWIQNGSI